MPVGGEIEFLPDLVWHRRVPENRTDIRKVKHMNGKMNVFIMGDSYSTYQGYIPEGYRYYYGDERMDSPVVRGVHKTWWNMLAKEKDLNIVKNDSFSGSTICNTVREVLTVESSFVSRMDKYIAEHFFAEHEIGTMLIFGGTNDSWIDAPVGSLKYSDWTAEDLKQVLPAFCYLISKAAKAVENIIVILNADLKTEITDGLAEACEANKIPYVRLEDIDKENGHPTEQGMKQICEQVAKSLKNSPDIQ